MWIMMNNSFLSIVAHKTLADDLLVRARRPGDIHRIFPEVVEETTPRADYLYRAVIPRNRVAQVMRDTVSAIKYPNFKASVTEELRAHVYMHVWTTMYQYQTVTPDEYGFGNFDWYGDHVGN